jgi:hypothetical protein
MVDSPNMEMSDMEFSTLWAAALDKPASPVFLPSSAVQQQHHNGSSIADEAVAAQETTIVKSPPMASSTYSSSSSEYDQEESLWSMDEEAADTRNSTVYGYPATAAAATFPQFYNDPISPNSSTFNYHQFNTSPSIAQHCRIYPQEERICPLAKPQDLMHSYHGQSDFNDYVLDSEEVDEDVVMNTEDDLLALSCPLARPDDLVLAPSTANYQSLEDFGTAQVAYNGHRYFENFQFDLRKNSCELESQEQQGQIVIRQEEVSTFDILNAMNSQMNHNFM